MKEDSGGEVGEILSFEEEEERQEEAEDGARRAAIEGKDALIEALQAKNRELTRKNFFASNPALFESSPGHSAPSAPQSSRVGGPPHLSEGSRLLEVVEQLALSGQRTTTLLTSRLDAQEVSIKKAVKTGKNKVARREDYRFPPAAVVFNVAEAYDVLLEGPPPLSVCFGSLYVCLVSFFRASCSLPLPVSSLRSGKEGGGGDGRRVGGLVVGVWVVFRSPSLHAGDPPPGQSYILSLKHMTLSVVVGVRGVWGGRPWSSKAPLPHSLYA